MVPALLLLGFPIFLELSRFRSIPITTEYANNSVLNALYGNSNGRRQLGHDLAGHLRGNCLIRTFSYGLLNLIGTENLSFTGTFNDLLAKNTSHHNWGGHEYFYSLRAMRDFKSGTQYVTKLQVCTTFCYRVYAQQHTNSRHNHTQLV